MMLTSLLCRGATILVVCKSLGWTSSTTRRGEVASGQGGGVIGSLGGTDTAPVPNKGKGKYVLVISNDDEVSSNKELSL
jgi:hypothetical protein